jgi:hypothetical protein
MRTREMRRILAGLSVTMGVAGLLRLEKNLQKAGKLFLK